MVRICPWVKSKERSIYSCSLANKLNGSSYITCYISNTNKWTSSLADHILKLLGGQKSWKSLLTVHAIDDNRCIWSNPFEDWGVMLWMRIVISSIEYFVRIFRFNHIFTCHNATIHLEGSL
uniref:Uncharacterized protein n=1 Tax=Opuntia streptacantha TaxID=393608 RepID=A0A7C9EQH8_OPUST